MSDFTQILGAIGRGECTAERLLPLIYQELRKLASHKMSRERPDHTLQPTALVHEAWLRLSQGERQTWENRRHFFSAAAEAMRHVLIDHARRKQAARRGGQWERIRLEMIDAPARGDEDTLLWVHESLEALGSEDVKAAELVKLRFFAGLSTEEAALALGVTDRTARRYWRFARAWLYDRLGNRES